MRRRLFAVASAISLLLFFAALMLDFRSYRTVSVLGRLSKRLLIETSLHDGMLRFYVSTGGFNFISAPKWRMSNTPRFGPPDLITVILDSAGSMTDTRPTTIEVSPRPP